VRLDEAAIVLAAVADESVDVDRELARLDEVAARCGESTLDGVARLLFGELGLRGNTGDYYAPENSFVPRVLDTGEGLPITLAVIMIEVGRRVGVPLVGVGMPGHFLVRDGSDPELFVDVFDGGRRLGREDCRRIFGTLFGEAPFPDEALDPTGPIDIVRRMLANLDNAFRRLGDHGALMTFSGLRYLLPDASTSDRMVHAARLESRHDFATAAELIESSLPTMAPDAATAARAHADAIRARLN